MADYIKCPQCELNYMLEKEKCCEVCDPKMKGKLISDVEAKFEAKRQEKLETYESRREIMALYYAYRYNKSPKY